MLLSSGAKKIEMKNQKLVAIAVRPVRPPSAIPPAESVRGLGGFAAVIYSRFRQMEYKERCQRRDQRWRCTPSRRGRPPSCPQSLRLENRKGQPAWTWPPSFRSHRAGRRRGRRSAISWELCEESEAYQSNPDLSTLVGAPVDISGTQQRETASRDDVLEEVEVGVADSVVGERSDGGGTRPRDDSDKEDRPEQSAYYQLGLRTDLNPTHP